MGPIRAIFILAFCLATACGEALADNADQIDRAKVIKAAFHDMEASLPVFLNRVVKRSGTSLLGARILARLPGPEAEAGFVWFFRFTELPDGSFVGEVDQFPDHMRNLRPGTHVRFSCREIVDWAFIGSSGEVFGQFTTRAGIVLGEIDPESDMAAALSVQALPDDWLGTAGSPSQFPHCRDR